MVGQEDVMVGAWVGGGVAGLAQTFAEAVAKYC